jgi:hypothetical protein
MRIKRKMVLNMRKLIPAVMLSIAVLASAFLGFDRIKSAAAASISELPAGESSQCKPCKRAGAGEDNKAPDVTALELDKTELNLPPRTENDPKPGENYSRNMTVRVITKAEDPEGDILTYNYTISGGRIIGTGAKVMWDLNAIRAGTYTITAGVDDGCGICGQTVTQTVTVTEN